MTDYKNKSAGFQVTRSPGQQWIRPTSYVSRLTLLVLSSLFLALSSLPSLFAAEINPGEKIVYDIKKMFKVGQATMEYKGPVVLDGKSLVRIIVTTRAPNFYDQEDIYVDPQNFYPIVVKRDLNVFGKKEKITERYNQEKGTIEIVKIVGGKETKQIIEKKAPIENLYGFIYQFRLKGNIKDTQAVTLHLPTKDVEFKNLGAVDVSVGRTTYQTVLLQSLPKQYSLWFDCSGTNLPIKIDGGLGAIKAVMILREVR